MGKRKVLFLVHVEEMFRRFFPDPLYPLRVRHSAMAAKYTRIIVLDSDIGEPGNDGRRGVIEEIASLPLETWSWSWGYEPGYSYDNDDPDATWTIPSDGHEATYVPAELRSQLDYFTQADVYIGGGCNGECLADWECVLEYLGIPYHRVEGLIYG